VPGAKLVLLAATRAEAPSERKLDGINLLPALRGERPPSSRTLFWRYKRAENRRKAVRDGDLKYLIDNGKEELYDLAKDEREEHNLLPAAADEAQRLKAKLADWERDVMAPRLRPFRSEPG
jgi:arylsulfatase A-like enzyme